MSSRHLPSLAFGTAVLLVAIAAIAIANTIPTGFGYDTAGPRLLPFIAGGGLAISALLVIASSFRRDPGEGPAEDAAPRTDWTILAVLSAALLVEAALIDTLGWIPTAATLFAAGAWAFGDRRVMLNLLIGVVFCGAIQALFALGLGIELPLGLLASLLPEAG